MKKAFSILELTIVLTIIGLLVAGIITGGKLLEQAKVRNYITIIHDLNESIMTFKNTYNALPGDMKNAASFGLGTNGDGDGKVEYNATLESYLIYLGTS